MKLKPSTLIHPLKPMSAHVLHALIWMSAMGGMTYAHAQTVSEELWGNSATERNNANTQDTTKNNSKDTTNNDLPYCSDIRASNRESKNETHAVGDSLAAVVNQDMVLKGRACVQRDAIQLQGDEIRYDYTSDQVSVNGNAKIIKPDGGLLTGEHIQYNLTQQTGQVSPANYTVSASQGHGTAQTLAILSSRRALLSQARYTTCQADDPDWYIKTDSMILDQDDDTATARNTTLIFKDVPVFGSPYLRVPLGNRRQSGFLTPSVSYSSSNGTGVSLPYYVNIAPNYDLTLTPQHLTQRGAKVSADYRYLTAWGEGSIYGDWLPYDTQTKNERHYWRAQYSNQGDLGRGTWLATIDVQKSSDNNYPDDFGAPNWDSGSRTLPSQYSLQYKTDDSFLRLRHKTYQTLQTSSNQVDTPYNFKTLLEARYKTSWNNWKMNTQLESTQFTHTNTNTKAQGWRNVLYPSLAYEWRNSGAFIVPKFGIHMSQYNLSSVPKMINVNNVYYPKNSFRNLPIFSLDTGLVLERKDVLFGQSISQTLEPRIYYAYIPYKDQSQLWNFDSALADLDFSRIYSENLFTGNDRIAQANQVTTGITSRILARDTGEELLQFGLAQRYYFSKQTVALSGIVETADAFRKSDLLAGASGKITSQLRVQAYSQFNSDTGKFLRADGSLHWQPAYRKVFNLGYHQNQVLVEPSKTTYASTQFPVPLMSNNLYAVARINYNLNTKRMTDAWAGFEYAKDCWILSLVGQRTLTSNNRMDTSISLKISLKGLGNTGTRVNSQLDTNIEGYHATQFGEFP